VGGRRLHGAPSDSNPPPPCPVHPSPFPQYIKEGATLQLPQPLVIPGFEFQANRDSTGNDTVRNTTATTAELGDICAADPNCKGFNTGVSNLFGG
jgi:hypothetical protein